MKLALLLCVLVAFGGVSSHRSSLGYQIDALEFKLQLSKIENYDRDAAHSDWLLTQASERHTKEILAFCCKWGAICALIIGFLHCAFLVFKDISETVRAYREAERNNLQNQERRIRELKRRFEALVRNEGSPFSPYYVARQDRGRQPVN